MAYDVKGLRHSLNQLSGAAVDIRKMWESILVEKIRFGRTVVRFAQVVFLQLLH
jgi:hypothetical protein